MGDTIPPTDPLVRDMYFKLLVLHNDNRKAYDTIKWETLKYAQLIFGGLMVVTFAALAGFREMLSSTSLRVVIGMLPLMAVFTISFALWNFWRESRLLFLEEASVFKVAHFLKLNRPLHESERWLEGDEDLLNPKWLPHEHPADDVDMPSSPLERWAGERSTTHMRSFPLVWLLVLFGSGALVLVSAILIWGATWSPTATSGDSVNSLAASVLKLEAAVRENAEMNRSQVAELRQLMGAVTLQLQRLERDRPASEKQKSPGR